MSSSPSSSNSGKTFTVDPSDNISTSTHKIRVTSGVKDISGNTLSSQYSTANGFSTSSQWSYITNNQISASGVSSLIQDNSNFYTSYYNKEDNGTYRNKLYIAKKSNNDSVNSWDSYDTNLTEGVNSTKQVISVDLTLFDNKIIVVWSEVASTYSHALKAAYLSNNSNLTSWTALDNGSTYGIESDFAEYSASGAKFLVANSKLHLFYKDGDTQARVFNGNFSSPSWDSIDGTLLGTIDAGASPVAVLHDSKIYMAASRNHQGGIIVSVFNGDYDSPSWTTVDGVSGDTSGISPYQYNQKPSLTTFNSNLYLTFWAYGSNKYRIMMYKYNNNDSSPSWEKLFASGYTYFNQSNNNIQHPTSIVYDNNLYVIWDESSPTSNRVAKLLVNNSSYSFQHVDEKDAGIYLGGGSIWQNLASLYNSKLYVSWIENEKLVIAKYQE
jgi:hypothetical protein